MKDNFLMDIHFSWAILKTFLVGALGGTTAFFALFRFIGQWWIERVKSRYSKELETWKDTLGRQQKLIQATIDRSVFVTQAHFETEFAAMKELFSYLSDVRLTMNTLRPQFGTSNPDKAEQMKVLTERYNAFSDAFNKLVKHQDSLSPFYSIELYTASDKCTAAAQTELYEVLTGGPFTFTPKWYQEGKKNREEFGKAYGEACEIIRERLSKLAVVPTSV